MSFRPIYRKDGIAYVFNTEAFNGLIRERKSASRKMEDTQTQDEIILEICEKKKMSYETVRNWAKGSNGPGDIDLVKDLAEYFDVDFMTLLIPKDQISGGINVNVDISGTDDKSVIKEFHSILTDFIYDYFGCEVGDFYLARHNGMWSEYFNEEKSELLFNLYRQLDKVSLLISKDTYDKLHRFITEIKVLSDFALHDGRPFLKSLLMENSRWLDINPHLDIVSEYSAEDSFEHAVKYSSKEQLDSIFEEFQKESDAFCTITYEYFTSEDCSYFPEPYELVPMELAKTLTMLFKKDFSEYYGG